MTAPATSPTPTALDEAGRAWDAAYALDDRLGHTRASEWTARQVRGLIRAGRAEDVAVLGRLADALEARLARETEHREATG